MRADGVNTAVGSLCGRFVTIRELQRTPSVCATLGNTTTGSNTAVGACRWGHEHDGYEQRLHRRIADAQSENLTNAVAIGRSAIVGASNSMVLGGSNMKVGIHTSTPNAAFDVDGALATRHNDLTLVNGANSDIALADTSCVRIIGTRRSVQHRRLRERRGRDDT